MKHTKRNSIFREGPIFYFKSTATFWLKLPLVIFYNIHKKVVKNIFFINNNKSMALCIDALKSNWFCFNNICFWLAENLEANVLFYISFWIYGCAVLVCFCSRLIRRDLILQTFGTLISTIFKLNCLVKIDLVFNARLIEKKSLSSV